MTTAQTATPNLEAFLRQTHADQGGEASFTEWLKYVADDAHEFAHEEANEYIGQLVDARNDLVQALQDALVALETSESFNTPEARERHSTAIATVGAALAKAGAQ